MTFNVPHETQDLCVASIMNARPPELPTMELALAHAKELFPLPRVVLDARKAIAQQASAAKIATILGNDQTLAARVVLLSNSPAFRGRMQVRDLSQAVARVGNKNLDETLLALGVIPRTSKNPVVARLLPRLLTVAAGCRVISGYQTTLETGTAFLTGLFLDMGQLLLAHGWPKEYESVLFDPAFSGGPSGDVIDEERNWLGFDHAELGAKLVKQWDVAQEIVEGVAFSHDLVAAMTDGGPIATTAAAITGLSSRIGRAIHAEIPRNQISVERLEMTSENAVLDLSRPVLEELVVEIEREAFALGAIFGN